MYLFRNDQKKAIPEINSAAKRVHIMAIFLVVEFESFGGNGRLIFTGHEFWRISVMPVKFDVSVSDTVTRSQL